jgi:predicted ATP-dependent endonuclease of OLD family
MKLMSVQLSDYKCIRDSCQFDVSDITCLVGKNESGKTAILEALYRLNPIVPKHGNFNVDDDYPRIDVRTTGWRWRRVEENRQS